MDVPVAEIMPLYFDSKIVQDGFSMFDNVVDVTYPENDLIKNEDALAAWMIGPGETHDFTGAIPATSYSEIEGAFIWNEWEEVPEVAFQIPQSERDDGSISHNNRSSFLWIKLV